MGIKIIDPKVFKGILEVPYDRKLIALALWYAWRYNNPTITSAHRYQKAWDGDSGIHMTIPCRALDWSIAGLEDPQKAVDDINNHWEYDPARPELKCAICHNVGQGPHIHMQVCEATVFHENGRTTI